MSQAPSQFQPATYRDQGGNRLNIKDAGELRHLGQGTVTQATDKSTGVTVNPRTGVITTNNASLAAAAGVTFTVTNSKVKATDVVVACIASGGTSGAYTVTVGAVGAGSFDLTLGNVSAGALGEAVAINYLIPPAEA